MIGNDASLGKRFFAMIIDGFLFIVLFLMTTVLVGNYLRNYVYNDSPAPASDTFNVIKWIPNFFFSLYFLYYVIMDSLLGGTLGKIFLHITIVTEKGNRISLIQSFLRTTLFFILAVPWIDFIPLLFGKNRCLHDIISKSSVKEIDT